MAVTKRIKRVLFNSQMANPSEVAEYIEKEGISQNDIISIVWGDPDWLFCVIHY